MTDRRAPITLAGSPPGETRHVRAFFGSEDEEFRVPLPFMKRGFLHDDKAVRVIDPDRRDAHLRQLAAAGIDIIRTHAVVILGGTLHHSPLFVAPERCLSEFRAGTRIS